MKITTILGARPQFIKSWALSAALRDAEIAEVVVHTGQHYDANMSDQFVKELNLAPPHYQLGIGSAPHGAQTGRMLEAIEQLLIKESPDWVVVYGDTNSTLAGALAAAKLHIPVAHVEAGLRSFNRQMPEEVNRVLTDHMSTLLFCPSVAAAGNLMREGITAGVSVVGDVMQDSILHFAANARAHSNVLERLQLKPGTYHVATVHRADLTDNALRLRTVLDLLDRMTTPVVLPLHPRTRAKLEMSGDPYRIVGNLRIIEPLGYLDMVRLVGDCQRVLTDSGGLQKEAYWLGRPCLTLREETEWVETVKLGWNTLVGTDPEKISAALVKSQPSNRPHLYGDGAAAEKIVAALLGKLAPHGS